MSLTMETAFIVHLHPQFVFPFPLPTGHDGPEGSLEAWQCAETRSEASEVADSPRKQ